MIFWTTSCAYFHSALRVYSQFRMRWTDFVYRQQSRLEPRDPWRLHYFAIVLNCPAPVLHALFWCTVVPLMVYGDDTAFLALETYRFVKDNITQKLATIYNQDQIQFSATKNEDQWQAPNGRWRIQCSKARIAVRAWHRHQFYDDQFFITMERHLCTSEKRGNQALQTKSPICGDYRVAIASRFDAFFEYANRRLSH